MAGETRGVVCDLFQDGPVQRASPGDAVLRLGQAEGYPVAFAMVMDIQADT
ncbi:hypothetical protein GCM10023116_08560 [Kistimonas scapharcae]|uniref:Uncharacterized protein n=1 Tax=Kistimonas scapharcae TaxID=1036133 RepID=A0ABP8V160_9GAMM